MTAPAPRWTLFALLLAGMAPPTLAQEASGHEGVENLGELEFPTSAASGGTQRRFERAMSYLHSFEYDEARLTFRKVQEREPGLAIAYWGEALTHYRPVWRQEDLEQARAVLARLAPTPEERAEKAGTDVERGLLGAVEVLFGEGDRATRWVGYSEAMGALSARHPFHVEIGALHCLSILGTALDGRDPRIYMRAAAVGERFHRREPRHPGLLHYLIHCYDDPVHAPLGLPMARVYDDVAPDAEHALHMPSHIYLPLGMWEETVASNIRSVAAADRRVGRMGWKADRRGWHAFLWQAYAHLQLGEREEARAMLAEVHRHAEELPARSIRFHFCHLRALYAVDTRAFDDPLVAAEVDLTGIDDSIRAMDRWVRGRVLLHRGDVDGVRGIITGLERTAPPDAIPAVAPPDTAPAAASCCAVSTPSSPSRQTLLAHRISALLLDAALAEHRGDIPRALDAFTRATGLEDRMALDYGPPESVPAHEELAAFLERRDRPGDAREHWRAALLRAPGRRVPTRALERGDG